MNTGIIRCGIAAILFGISAPAASRLTDDMGAFTLAGLLYLGAALAVSPFVGRTPPTRAGVRASLPNLSIAVVLGGAVGPVLLAVGLGLVPAATASLLLNLELVFTTIVASLVFHEHLGRSVITGTALVVAGSVALTWSGNPDLRWGALLIAAACLCWAIDNSTTAAIDQISPSHITLAKGVIAGGTNLIIGLATTSTPTAGPILWALLVGGFGYGASITLWVSGARDLGAARGQLVFATAPFVGALVAWTVFNESVTRRELLAFGIAASGVAFVLGSHHEHDHTHESMSHSHDHDHDEHHDHHPDALVTSGRHTHLHVHAAIAHQHPHLPDLHHRHDH
ncbi:MAG TPA: DMT family transporter [Actinomycetota bacterium]